MYDFLFDTGSSLFELWTTKRLWKKLRSKQASIDNYPISSWGEINTAFRTEIKNGVFIPSFNDFKLETIWYNSNKSFHKLLSKRMLME